MFAETESVTVTTASDGSVTAYTTKTYTGRVLTCVYTKTDYEDTVDFTITGETTGVSVWVQSNVTASTTVAPRQATHLNTTGAAALYAAGGTSVNDHVWIANERIKIVLASGGNAKVGAFRFIVG